MTGDCKDLDLQILACDIDPVLIERAMEKNSHTSNIHFVTLNLMDRVSAQETFVSFLKQFNRTKFDITFCFSLTMWIHLQNGDEGLKDFLKQISTLSRYVLIEPQPWKCYKSAARRVKKLGGPDFDHYKDLKIRDSVEEYVNNFLISDCAMEVVVRFGSTTWGRTLTLYKSTG